MKTTGVPALPYLFCQAPALCLPILSRRSPSRACVLTGQYNHVNGAFDLSGRVAPGKQMLAIEMRRAGYHTAMIGKWHLKDEPADFDHYCVLPGQGKYHAPEFRVRGDKPWGKNLIKFPGKHSTDAITDLTLDWLKDGWDQDKPFFLMHHYKAPHDYFDNAARYESYLAEVDIPEPKTLWYRDPHFGSLATRGANDELLPHVGTSIGGRNPRRSYLGDLPSLYPNEFPARFDPDDYTVEQNTRLAYNAYLKKYLRCVKGIDDNLGRLFQHLEETGDEPDDWKQEAYYRYWMHMAHHDNPAHLGIRTKTHKLIYYYGCNYDGGYQTPAGWELYDLVNDPQETINLYNDPAHAELVAELKSRLAATRKRVGDDGSHYPKCEAIVQEFWDYDEADRAKACEISGRYLKRRQQELEAGKRNIRTHQGE